jgi:hypothetical protein
MTAPTVELGGRAADAIRAENHGLTGQRVAAIRDRKPRRLVWGWLIEYDSSGMAARMRPATRIEP